MGISFSGDISLPIWEPGSEIYAQGSIIVYPEQVTGIIVGGQVIEATKFTCSRSNTQKVGDCTIEVPDGGGLIKSLINIEDDIRIFYKHPDEEEPTLIWRGYVEDLNYAMDTAQVLIIKGSELTKILFETTVSETYNLEEIADIVKDLLNEKAPIFDTSNITATGRSLTIELDNERVFDAINLVLSPFGCRMIINTDYTVNLTFIPDLSITTDEVDTDNIEVVREVDSDVALYTKITVQGADETITYTAEDTSGTYRTREIKLIKPEIKYSADAQIYAENLLATRQDPIKRYELNSEILSHTEPGHLVLLDYPTTSLDGTTFEVRTIIHKFENNSHRSTIIIEDDTQYFEELISGMSQGLFKTMNKVFE